jgi:hypothetical protein
MMPSIVEDGRELWVEAFLVEMHSLSGFSGSPVFVHIPPGSYRGKDKGMMPFYSEEIGLVGIDTGHKQLTSPVLGPLGQETGMRVKLNTGVAIVSPVWKILEVLNEDEFVKQRKEVERKRREAQAVAGATSDVALEPSRPDRLRNPDELEIDDVIRIMGETPPPPKRQDAKKKRKG